MSIETVHVRDYGQGLVEVSWNFRKRQGECPDTRRGESENAWEIHKASVRRARRQITRKVLHGGMDYLLSIDYRENVLDLDRAKRDLSAFLDLVQAAIPGWKYCGTWERQKRGAWHFHLAVCGWQNVELLRRLWHQVVGPKGGNIDAQAPKARKSKNARVEVAGYLSKYIGKQLTEWELNKKMYFHSRNAEDPPVAEIAVVLDGNVDVWDVVLDLIQSRGGEKIEREWCELMQRWGWAASF